MSKAVEVLLSETREFPAPDHFKAAAEVDAKKLFDLAEKDRLRFWEEQATQLDWFKPWDNILEWDAPYAKWFQGAKLNACYNCVDRHVKGDLAHKSAILWEGEDGAKRSLSYSDLHIEVQRMGHLMKKLGVEKGDRVAIYMPMVPEAIIAMLACARIGAVHTVVFGGFSAQSLEERINDAGAKLLITADGGYRRGKVVPLKDTADKAVENCPSIENILVIKRLDGNVAMKEGRDHWYHDHPEVLECPAEPMDSEDLLFILYTSGTTGKPKGIMHTTGGYLLGATVSCQWVFDMKPTDIFWCTADVGWITGHSYIVYGPLANGMTQVIYEGAPDWPERDRLWEICDRYGVTTFYTAPTAIRAFMKWGTAHPEKHRLSSLRLLGTVGEPINPEAWMWYYRNIGREKCPIVDTWWQTETGSIVISAIPSYTTLKPGSASKPLPGYQAAIMDDAGNAVEKGGGLLGLTAPWPSMLRGIWGDPERFQETYWNKWDGKYFTGDGAHLDADGYFWLMGRVDDVMNVAGHRIGTAEVESALVDHHDVAESAVVGIEDEVKGEAIAGFVIMKEGREESEAMAETLKRHVAEVIGPIAKPSKIIFTPDLPKTRSGKIMRRLLRDIASGRVLGDVTTLADASVVDALKQKYQED